MIPITDKINEDGIMNSDPACHNDASLKGLLQECPICGKEFSCTKSYHVYTALAGHRRQYYCSYHCFKQRPNPKPKL